ncbi:MAG TPA: hypothetical protein DCG49_11010 [Ruminococcus sp.]|nr:hypothetical protein [Ruminococcus sp.]
MKRAFYKQTTETKPFSPVKHPHFTATATLRKWRNQMKEQNPLWRNGQIPSSETNHSSNDAERDAQEANRKSEQQKRSH